VTCDLNLRSKWYSMPYTTYPTLQRIFVVTYVILTLRAFGHRQAQFPRSPLIHPPHAHPSPSRADISRASGGRYLPALHSPITPRVNHAELEQINLVPGLYSRIDADKDMEK
jgi:hypothetical protein